MASSDELTAFIASSFRSVWALELLLLLKREGRPCSPRELVHSLRASPAVVDIALETLIAAGLAGGDGEAFAYMPPSAGIAQLVEETEQLYRSRPAWVRRLIVASANKGLVAFSDAFRLKD
jgi:DNA-binding IclR family transcriptional regulator